MSENCEVVLKKMGTPGPVAQVSDEKIIATGKAMEDQGLKVTGWSLRGQIGAGGSTYLMRKWTEYKEQQGVSKDHVGSNLNEHYLAPELEDKIKILIGDISKQVDSFAVASDLLANTNAEKKARSNYENVINDNQELIEQQDIAEALLAEADASNLNLNEQMDELRSQISALEKVYLNVKEQLSHEKENSIRLKESLNDNTIQFNKVSEEKLQLEKQVVKLEMIIENKESTIIRESDFIQRFEEIQKQLLSRLPLST
jgi:colicin import membrane protein